MKKFIFICGGKEFHPALYPELFKYIASLPKGIAFTPRVFAFEHEGSAATIRQKILSYARHPEEFYVFEISDADAVIQNPLRNEKFRAFYQDTKHP